MRDKSRIDRIIVSVGKYWKANPDLRFGQLLIVLGLIEDTYLTWSTEDDITERKLKENMNKLKKLK